MKYFFTFLLIIIVVGSAAYLYYINSPFSKNEKRTMFGKAESMILQSNAFKTNQPIPSKYTCDTENISPPVNFNAVPYGTKSLVLIMEDQDSNPKGFTHWVIFNINQYSNGLDENIASDNITEGKNDFGENGYGGPCPGEGTHKYVFKLFAINTILLLPRGSTKEEVLSAITGHIIEESELTGTYKKL